MAFGIEEKNRLGKTLSYCANMSLFLEILLNTTVQLIFNDQRNVRNYS